MLSLIALLLAVQADPGAGPDRGAALTPPSRFHGNWRVIAADDRHDQATMRIDILHSRHESTGLGSYVLFQPFCDLVAGKKITGISDCELIGTGGELTFSADRSRMIVTFLPTADGAEHHLILRPRGGTLTGTYKVADYSRKVRLEPVPE